MFYTPFFRHIVNLFHSTPLTWEVCFWSCNLCPLNLQRISNHCNTEHYFDNHYNCGGTMRKLLETTAEKAIQYLENETSKRELLRTTMKSLEDKLKPYAVIRCHRSFMVNINNIEKVVGNAHKLNLYIPYSKLPVPVSRSYVPIIKTILGIHHK